MDVSLHVTDNSVVVIAHAGGATVCSSGANRELKFTDRAPYKRGRLLHESERKFITAAENVVCCWDLESGKPESHKVDRPVSSLCAVDKYSPLRDTSTICVLGNKFVGILDTRIGRCMPFFTYKTPQHFSCAVTTEDGHVVAGTRAGKRSTLKFFRSLGQRACSVLSVQEDVLGVDVSPDGSLVVVATAHSVALVRTTTKDGKSAFTSRVSALLQVEQLFQADQDTGIVETAKFDRPDFNDVQWIVVATTKKLLSWKAEKGHDFKAVARQDLPVMGDTGFDVEFALRESTLYAATKDRWVAGTTTKNDLLWQFQSVSD